MAVIRLGPKRWRTFHAVYAETEHTAAPSQPSELPGSRRRPDTSGRHGRLIEPTTVRLPAIRPDTGLGTARLRAGFRRTPLQSRMGGMTVMVPLELLRKCRGFHNMLWAEARRTTRSIFMLRGEPRS